MSGPLVSVVIPVYNGERFLDAALASVFAQDHRPLEVIVVDDGSTDGTPEILARWPDVVVVRQANQGAGRARDAGIARARGELVAFQDADDLWAPEKLRLQVAHLEAHPEHDYVVAYVRSFLEPGCERPAWVPGGRLDEPRLGGIGNILARRDLLARLGAFGDDPTDADWSVRAHQAGARMGVVSETLLFRRVHDQNLSWTLDGPKLRFAALRAAIARKRGGP